MLKKVFHYKQIALVLVYVIKHIHAIASLFKGFKHILLHIFVWIFPKLATICSVDADEAGHDSWLKEIQLALHKIWGPSFHRLISES